MNCKNWAQSFVTWFNTTQNSLKFAFVDIDYIMKLKKQIRINRFNENDAKKNHQ